MNANPIIKRETRVRWRGARSFLLVLAYAAILTIATAWRYGNLLSFEYSMRGATVGGVNTRPSVWSRELFQVLSVLQIAGWMILAPALTATGLAGERERGLLEAVQLSRMTPSSILFGKLLSALSFIALMMPVALPIVATSFLMGGVSPQEIVLTAVLQFVTAIMGASVGLYFSARSRRAPGALATAFVFVGVWSMGSYAAYGEWQSGAPLFGPPTQWPGLVWGLVNGALGWTNPVVAALDLINPISAQAMWALPFGWIFKTVPLWAVNIGLQLGLSVLLLWMATRALRKPLPDVSMSDQSLTDPVRQSFTRLMEASAARAANARERATQRMAQRAGAALLWELPLHKMIRFRNPVLQREVRGKFRMRRSSLGASLFQGLVALVGLGIYVMLLFTIFDPLSRENMWWTIAPIALSVLMLACAVMGASAFTRERENGTWEGLQLSLLPPREVISAKFLAPLIACFYYSLPILPVLLFYVRWMSLFEYSNNSGIGDDGIIGFGQTLSGVPPALALATLLVLGSAAAVVTAWGLFISTLCRRTVVSVGWTLSSLLLGLFLLPLVFSSAPGQDHIFDFISWWHPFTALEKLYVPSYDMNTNMTIEPTAEYGVRYALLSLFCVFVLLALSHFFLRRGLRPSKQSDN